MNGILRTAIIPMILLALCFCSGSANASDATRAGELLRDMRKLEPLHKSIGKPQLGEWLYHYHEAGQTFINYYSSNPKIIHEKWKVIYFQPLGKFTPLQRKVMYTTAEFVSLYFGLRVRIRKPLRMVNIPARAKREITIERIPQVNTDYVLDEILLPDMPDDALMTLGFVSDMDLCPDDRWDMKFVFGMARLQDRVAVVSMYRNGDPKGGWRDYHEVLKRNMKTAAHEIGHTFGIPHCVEYMCNMNGRNSRSEADRQPLWLCPHCMAKICLTTGADPAERFRLLAEFCHRHRFEREEIFFHKSRLSLIKNSAEPVVAAGGDRKTAPGFNPFRAIRNSFRKISARKTEPKFSTE